MNDPVNHPAHYTSHPSGVECIQVTEHYNFCVGNAIKYLWRNGLKSDEGSGSVKDLKKAIWYIQREISNIEKGVYDGKDKQEQNQSLEKEQSRKSSWQDDENAIYGYTTGISPVIPGTNVPSWLAYPKTCGTSELTFTNFDVSYEHGAQVNGVPSSGWDLLLKGMNV